jgi:hypothetical protein
LYCTLAAPFLHTRTTRHTQFTRNTHTQSHSHPHSPTSQTIFMIVISCMR